MTDAALYERISHIRADLLEVIGMVGTAEVSLESSATVMQDDLIMVANRLGRVASQLRRQTATSELGEPSVGQRTPIRIFEPALNGSQAPSHNGAPLRGQ